MGQSSACSCEGHKDQELNGFSPRAGGPNDMVMAAMPDKSGAVSLDRLKGFWKTETDMQMMGEIVNGTIQWDEAFNHARTPLRISPNGAIEMELLNNLHQATYSDGPPPCLRWDDGEVWVKVRDP
mmetsp:Transcript_50674/g.117656  ORF Transcript_50674/g.117656 Transcript_50674/m.117656 type:complete len:125 (+) Transcript_50674:61-435(+)